MNTMAKLFAGLRVPGSLLVILAFLGGSGCFESEPDVNAPAEEHCKYWVPKLKTPSRQEKALKTVEEYQCKEALPHLEALYDEGFKREKLVRVVKMIGDKKGGIPLLRKALKQRKTAKLTAGIAMDWKLTELAKDLIGLLSTSKIPDARKEQLKALLAIEEPKNLVDVLIKVVETNITDGASVAVNSIAIDALGKLASKKALPALVKSAFMRTIQNLRLYSRVASDQTYGARTAIAACGLESIPLLVSVLQGKNEAVNQYAEANGIHKWEYTQGPEIIQLLVDTLDPAVVGPIVDAFTVDLEANKPLGMSPHVEQMWVTAQLNRLKISMLGLGYVGIREKKDFDKLFAVVLDKNADGGKRLNALSAIAYSATPEVQDRMLEILKTAVEKYDFVEWHSIGPPMLYPILEAIDYDHLLKFKEIMYVFGEDGKPVPPKKLAKMKPEDKATLKPPPHMIDNLNDSRIRGYIKVLEECQNDHGCIIKKLDEQREEKLTPDWPKGDCQGCEPPAKCYADDFSDNKLCVKPEECKLGEIKGCHGSDRLKCAKLTGEENSPTAFLPTACPAHHYCKQEEGGPPTCLLDPYIPSKWEVMKAAMLLAKGGGDDKVVNTALLNRFSQSKKSMIDIKTFTLVALCRRGGEEVGKELIKLADQTAAEDPFWPGQLRSYGHYLVHQANKKKAGL